ncbi:MAG: hypothetical protein GXX96_34560 [Planctomycetaceae bacterium]|nr:hypothetical protein [Planctomycetaceae bacterium]
MHFLRQSGNRSVLGLVAVVGVLCLREPAFALSPQDPSVKAAVSRAVRFLESDKGKDARVGAKAVVGLALLKSGANRSHPLVQEAIAGIRESLNVSTPQFSEMYTPGLSLIFLVELDSPEYRSEIQKLLRYLESVQKPHGGWGYPGYTTGDTSMTQYVVLGLWEASRSGIDVRTDLIDRCLVWLLKTRDPSGGFGYQGKVSDSFRPIAQEEVRPGVSLAGLASVYACADLLGLYENRKQPEGLPPALTKIQDQKSGYRGRADAALIDTTVANGAGWISKNFTVKADMWPFYYLYTLERYFSFREYAESGPPKQIANWYDVCGSFLLETQQDDGSWHDPGWGRDAVACNTAWGILFLVRSMRKSLEQRARSFGAGTLVGGRGLPSDSEFVQMQGGKVVSTAEMSDIEKLITNLREGNDEQFTKTVGVLPELPPDEAKALVSQAAARLRDLAGGTSADLRLGAVQALARAGTLDDVPMLIYALTDPEAEIVLAARDGLRRISRKIHGLGLPDDFDEGDRVAAVKAWKEWYLTIRPDAEFE